MSTTLAPTDTQGRLFEVPSVLNAGSEGAARYIYGEAAQRIVYAHLGITPIPINGKFPICFDGCRGETYYEIKSLNFKRGKVVLYKWRMEKEESAGVPLDYILVCHDLSGDREDIVTAMAGRSIRFYILPSRIVHDAAKKTPLRMLKREAKGGYARNGYKNGYHNVSLLQIVGGVSFREVTVANQLGAGDMTLRVATDSTYVPVNGFAPEVQG
jgi:hypothetical protein